VGEVLRGDLGGKEDFLPVIPYRVPDEGLGPPVSVDLGRVDELHPELYPLLEGLDLLPPLLSARVSEGPGAHPDDGNLLSGLSEDPGFHPAMGPALLF
jgi:hypothetical protein